MTSNQELSPAEINGELGGMVCSNQPSSAPIRLSPSILMRQPQSELPRKTEPEPMRQTQYDNNAYYPQPYNPGYSTNVYTSQPMPGYLVPNPVSHAPNSQQQRSNNNIVIDQTQTTSDQQQPIVITYDDFLIISIFATIFCFFPTGIVAIIKSLDARSARNRREWQEASDASRTAWRFVVASMIIIYIIFLIVFIPAVIIIVNGR